MPDQMIVRGVAGVVPSPTSTGRNRWIVTDDQGQDWTVWDANTAMQASQLQQQGQLAQMRVSIKPANDPQYGINYTLRAIAPAPMGAVPGPLPPPEVPQMQMPQMQQPMQMPMQQPQMQMPVQPGAQMNVPPMASMPPNMPENLRPAAKTMGQGGVYSDSDLTRMARTSGIVAAIDAAFAPEDFRDEDNGEVDWEKVYAVAEAATKFILFRKHEGWVPGVEVNPSDNARAVLAEVNAQFPGAVEMGAPTEYDGQQPEEAQPQLPADQAAPDDSDIPWGSQ